MQSCPLHRGVLEWNGVYASVHNLSVRILQRESLTIGVRQLFNQSTCFSEPARVAFLAAFTSDTGVSTLPRQGTARVPSFLEFPRAGVFLIGTQNRSLIGPICCSLIGRKSGFFIGPFTGFLIGSFSGFLIGRAVGKNNGEKEKNNGEN